MRQSEKRRIALHLTGDGSDGYPVDREDLQRTVRAAVGNHLIVYRGVIQRNRLRALTKQIHHWNAAERERVGGYPTLQLIRRAGQIQIDVALARGATAQFGGQARDLEEQKFLWKSEILGQQPVPHGRARAIWQQALRGVEPHRANRRLSQEQGARISAGLGDSDRRGVVVDQLVEKQSVGQGAAQEKAQRVRRQLSERGLRRQATQRQAQHTHAAPWTHRSAQRPTGQGGALNLHRPDSLILGRTKDAILAADRLGLDLGP